MEAVPFTYALYIRHLIEVEIDSSKQIPVGTHEHLSVLIASYRL